MKLYLDLDNYDYQPERYKYAVEQMMLTLFPEERPEYPPREGRTLKGETNAARFTLRRSPVWTTVRAQVYRPQGMGQAAVRVGSGQLDRPPEQVYHTLQHALKMAFYQAGTALLGGEPPWGALTGVRPVKLPTRAMLAGATEAQACRELEREYHVSPRRARLAVECARASLAEDRQLEEGQVSLYIGIPFCPTRCAYCSFVSADVGRALKLVDPYVEALLEEVRRTGQVLEQAGLRVRTLYVGGGTPTTLSASQLDRLLAAAEAHLPLAGCREMTVEAGRPDTITREKLEVLRQHGVSRISINPQTLEDTVLRAIGRRHTAQDIREAYYLAREVDFACINMDLIAGLPQDSVEGFRDSLEEVLALRPENITVHTLAMKKGSRLMEEGGALPSGEETGRMVDLSLEALEGAGYRPYYLYRQKYMSGGLENVSWCLPGTENHYNIIMMEELQSVLSLGAGGVTKLVDRSSRRIVRLTNPKYPHDYLAMSAKVLEQKDEILRFYREV